MKLNTFIKLLILAMLVSGCTMPLSNDTGGSNTARAWFDAPLPNTVIRPPNPCQLVAHGASPNGIAAFELTVNGKASSIQSPDTKNSLVTLTHDCGFSQPGEYKLLIRARDNSGTWSGYAETSLSIAGGETQTPGSASNCVDKLNVISENPLQKAYMLPGQNFTKTWTVQNTGTCTWNSGYHFVFTGGPSPSDGGSSMGGPSDTPLGSLVSVPVSAGQQITISLPLVTPMTDGWYVGAWNVVDSNGQKVPITYGGSDTMPSMYADIVVKAGTPTPPVSTGSVTIQRISTDTVYLGGTTCGPVNITFLAHATAPKGIKVVVLFYRFASSSSPAGFQNVAMNPTGNDLYQVTLNPTSILGGSIPFDQATLQYQIVVQQNDNDTSIRTPVMADVSLQACGNVTVTCSNFTDKRTCEANGCKWAAKPGTIPIYVCQKP